MMTQHKHKLRPNQALIVDPVRTTFTLTKHTYYPIFLVSICLSLRFLRARLIGNDKSFPQLLAHIHADISATFFFASQSPHIVYLSRNYCGSNM